MHDAAFLLYCYSEIAISWILRTLKGINLFRWELLGRIVTLMKYKVSYRIIHITSKCTQNRIFSNLNILVRVFVAICKTSASMCVHQIVNAILIFAFSPLSREAELFLVGEIKISKSFQH